MCVYVYVCVHMCDKKLENYDMAEVCPIMKLMCVCVYKYVCVCIYVCVCVCVCVYV